MAQPALRILLAASEAVPFAKTGGLGDVAGALAKELARLGLDLRLVLPRYGVIDGSASGLSTRGRLIVPTPTGAREVTIEHGTIAVGRQQRPAEVYAIRYDPYFARPGLYTEAGQDYPDNLERFAFFSRAILELVRSFGQTESWRPDLIHTNDWQTALCPVYLRTLYANEPGLADIPTVFTIHNMGFQGLFPATDFTKTGLPSDLLAPHGLEFHGRMNLMKGALTFADALTTVSPTYGREIQSPELGFGLDDILRARRDHLVGIVNGIDVDVWNPATDPYLTRTYSVADLSGKHACKAHLQQRLNLPIRDVPLLGMVSRFTVQKGVDLLADVLPEVLSREVQVVLLGTGETALESRLTALQARHPSKMGLQIGFDDALAHRIEAGADIFLMPSRYEPCGLTQLYSLRYGTVPIVRKTGGLADTVVAYSPQAADDGRATGFQFSDATPQALLGAILLALRVYENQNQWAKLIRAGMSTDVSWEHSAREYVAWYRTVRGMT